ncbi:ribonuclease D [Propioniciclava sinopodophylli]|uniref:ribonuclease D n=1 Tax=Propioniciclava sinopodophylli TaxID=1837344 RepID=UPI0013F15D16|nr:ribonuclease D [Propioniciclava sinopodophylli]
MTDDLPDELADRLRVERRVAVDTETTGLNWREDTLELCQIYSPGTGAILVRRSWRRPTNLLDLLEDSRVTKVLHYAPFDLRFLESTWGVRSESVFCTKAASKLLDPLLPPAEHSLSALLARHFGIRLDKGAVRVSNWAAPDLTLDQIAYAAADVSSLLMLADSQEARLRERGLAGDFAAICTYMPLDAHLEISGIPNPLAY